MLGVALDGIPRDSYRLMSKVTTRDGVDPRQKIDELRKLANTDYFDVMLLHWQHLATWPTDSCPVARRHFGSPGETSGDRARCVGARPPGVAPGSGEQVAPDRHDPDES